MTNFLLREVFYNNIQAELESIGFDAAYLIPVAEKFRYKNIKIYNLSVAQANILKQTALIYGADCAVNRDVITGKAETSDVILCGSYSQLNKIAEKLKLQPFKLAILANNIQEYLLSHPAKTTKIVGILNITPDSFSDGGLYYKEESAQKKLMSLIEDGADVIDIGAESTRPYSKSVDAKEQIQRLKPIFNFINKSNIIHPISIDTRNAEVADFALNNGATIINDVSGFDFDINMPDIIAKYNAGVVIQHSSEKAEDTNIYQNVVDSVFRKLELKINIAKEHNIQNIIVDPGIGFGKSRIENMEILSNINSLFSLQCPVMVGISRKSILNAKNYSNEIKDSLSLAYSYPLIMQGVDYLRVHDVKLHKILLNTLPI